MNKKRIISILLVVILLFNSILPIVNVNAVTNNVFEFNQQLYKAIKTSLKDHKIVFTSNDVARTIEISDSELEKVTELILNEKAIYDLTNIDSFKYLNHLDISGNNLSEKSNLEVLNNLTSLNYLDLSSNNLLDISAIDDLILKIQNENGTVLLSNQVATIVYDAVVDIEEDSNNEFTATYKLPEILEKAGIIKSVWRNAEFTLEDGHKISGAGFIESMSNPVTADNNFIEVKISSEKGYLAGLAKLEIYIYDDKTEAGSAANINPAANNILVGSRFTIYVVVHDSESEAIYLPDTNLYTSVKEQLTGGQEVNSNLPTYKYLTNPDSSKYEGKYFYMADIENRDILYLFDQKVVERLLNGCMMPNASMHTGDITTMGRTDIEKVLVYNMYMADYVLNKKTGEIYYMYNAWIYNPWSLVDCPDKFEEVDGEKYWYHSGEMGEFEAIFVTKNYEETVITLTDDISGHMTQYQGYKFAPINFDSFKNLYDAAYDEAKILTVPYEYLYSTINSLILNNKEIRDLTGIEKFVGLQSEFNVSHNYLNDIEPIYNLQDNKNIYEARLQEKYNYYLKTRSYGNLTEALNNTKSSKESADKEVENVIKAREDIIQKFKEALEIKQYTEKEITKTNADGTTEVVIEKTTNENYENEIKAKAEEINAIMKNVYGYEDEQGVHVYGYLENLTSYLNSTVTNVEDLYNYLSLLYKVYNNEYKLTTILTPELNYQTLEEYEAYETALNSTTDNVKTLFINELERIVKLSENQALSEFEKIALRVALGTDDIPEYLAQIQNTPGTRLTWVKKIESIREVALYSEMANYCLIKRMETETNFYQCYMEEYIKERIKEFSIEGIDTTFEENVLNKLSNINNYMMNIMNQIDFGEIESFDDCIMQIPESERIFFKFMLMTRIPYEYVRTRIPYESLGIVYPIYIFPCCGSYTKLSNIMYEETYLDLDTIAEKVETGVDNENLVALYNAIENTRIINTITLEETIDEENEFKGDLNLYKEVVALAGKFVTNSAEVSRYISLPKLKKLDISYNAYLSGVEKITELSGLKELYAGSDYLSDVSNIDWSMIKYLRKLDLSYNFLTTIKPLEVLKNIEMLNVSNNLLSGALEFNLTNSQKTLKEFNLSGNQLEDITDIMNFLDAWTNGNDGNYLAREDTININLNNQTININVAEPVDLLIYNHTVDIELPKIFTQLKAIDVNRTTFGETSQNGRIESEGKYVTLLTDTVGNKEGVVAVKPILGYNTCVGNGTKAIIKYNVVENKPVVNNVEIKAEDTLEEVKAGDSITFTANVTGENLNDTSVTWSIEGNESENTVISEDGILVIAEDETAEKITVIATSNFDASKIAQYEVLLTSVDPEEPTDPIEPTDPVDPEEPTDPTEPTNPVDPEEPTDPIEPTDPVDPEEPTDPTEPTDPVDPEEPTDPTEPTEPVDPEEPTNPEKPGVDFELGYKENDEYLMDIAPKTPIEDFKTIVLNGEKYEVVIRKDGEAITSGIMTTGMYVHFLDRDGEPLKNTNGDIIAYEVIVKGDINGDGYANALDSLLIKSHRTEVNELKGDAFVAADIDGDGKVNIADSKLLLYHRAEVKGYDLNFSK